MSERLEFGLCHAQRWSSNRANVQQMELQQFSSLSCDVSVIVISVIGIFAHMYCSVYSHRYLFLELWPLKRPAGHRSAGFFIHGKHLFWSIARGEGASRSVTSRRICKSNRHANASCAVHQTALSLLRGAFFMHRMRARMPRIAFSPLRGAIFLHRMCACMPIIVLSLLRGAIFSGAKPDDCCLSPAGRIFIEMR